MNALLCCTVGITSREQRVDRAQGRDSVAGYTVSEILSKRLKLTSDNGDQITLTLFEPEELRD